MSDCRSPLIFGEVLFDCFEDRQVLGGAPFNVAWSLRGLGLAPLFVSRVGDDPLGHQVIAAMSDWGMDTRWVQRDSEHPTGRVRVEIARGEPKFEITADQAYDYIDANDTLSRLKHLSLPLLYHGTLAVRHDCSRRALHELRAGGRLATFVDVNLRPPWWEPVHVTKLIRGANWVKLNEAELIDLSGKRGELETLAESFQHQLGIDVLIVTRGERGAFALVEGERFAVPGVQVERVVDTVGAGDAFSAVLVIGILNRWPWPVALGRAAAFAASVCGQRGAIQQDPSIYLRTMHGWTDA